MKKQTLIKSLLILLPVLAVGLATTGDSVIVFDSLAGVTEYYSYFEMAPETQWQTLPPLAAMLAAISGILAAVYMVKKKKWCLRGIVGTTMASACAAVIPVVQQGDVRMVPNVGLPIFMMVNCLVAYHFLKHPEKTEEKKPPRKIKRK